MLKRVLAKNIKKRLFSGKAVILYGARQVGKSSLLKEIFGNRNDVVWFDGDTPETKTVFENLTLNSLKMLVGNAKIVIVDEAQNIENIGIKLKLFTDYFKDVQLLATGSSSFDLANKINEPLTGRIWNFLMFPFCFSELSEHTSVWEERKQLETRLIFGCYPDVVCNPQNAPELIKTLASSYLYKDILQWESLKKSDRLIKLLQALAYQIGSQVSYTELGTICGLDNKTIEKYISLLEQAFVIFRLPSFNRNARNELKFAKKIYFYDNGIRNALIANYNQLALRTDVGVLWENFLVSERAKRNAYTNNFVHRYFWRNTAQKEIDYLEESGGKLHAYEFKWNSQKKYKIPTAFSAAYTNCEVKLITPENYIEFIEIVP